MNKIKSPTPSGAEQIINIYFIPFIPLISQEFCLYCKDDIRVAKRAFCALSGEKISSMDLQCLFLRLKK